MDFWKEQSFVGFLECGRMCSKCEISLMHFLIRWRSFDVRRLFFVFITVTFFIFVAIVTYFNTSISKNTLYIITFGIILWTCTFRVCFYIKQGDFLLRYICEKGPVVKHVNLVSHRKTFYLFTDILFIWKLFIRLYIYIHNVVYTYNVENTICWTYFIYVIFQVRTQRLGGL